MINEDLYDTGSAVVGLYGLFTNFLDFLGESPGLGGSIGGGGGGGVLGITGPSPSYPSFFILLSIKTIRDHQRGNYTQNYSRSPAGGTIPETGKKHLITLSAHNFFYNCSVKIILYSIVPRSMCFTI